MAAGSTSSGWSGREAPSSDGANRMPSPFPDPRFRGIELLAAPDGGVFVADWNDAGECHDHDGVHRSSGRIFKLAYGEPRQPATGDLAALDPAADLPLRRAALDVLVESRAPGLREVATQLLRVRSLTARAAAGLALFDDPAIADLILSEWHEMYGLERPPVMNVLVSRPAWAARALEALAAGTLRRSDFTAAHARQIRAYRIPELTRRLTELWGPLRDESDAAQEAVLANWSARLTPERLAGADRTRGRALYLQRCGSCHQLNGEGGQLGPDLTGAARDNLGYLLENILFPSAVVADDQRLTTVTLKDGRTLAGLRRGPPGRTVQLQTMTERVAVPAADIVREETLPQSLMPPGLLDDLANDEARDLIAYLMTK